MRGYGRHVRFYKIMRRLVGAPVKWLLRFQTDEVKLPDGPVIIASNHNTDFDSILLATAFPKHMYFVASEHIFRSGLIRRFFMYFLDPIPKRKGGADVATAVQMARRLKKGMNVMLFAEGNKSFDGVTCPVHPATGAMVKACGAALVTYRLEGGYFTSPRWASTLRRGRMRGVVVRVFTPEEIAAMSEAAVSRAIAEDIFEDAYLRQTIDPVAYHGKRLAEGIENALYMCPRCREIGTLKGMGDRVSCGCGFQAAYTDMGYLTGEDVPFHTMKVWGDWQREQLRALIRASNGEALFSDPDQGILKIHPDHRVEEIARGTLSMGLQGLTCGGLHLPLDELMGFEIYGRSTIVFSDDGGNRYQVRSGIERSALKYFEAYELMRQK